MVNNFIHVVDLKVVWYILSASVIMGTMTSILATNNNSTNGTATRNTISQIDNSSFTNHIGFRITIWLFVIATVAKEIGELVFCSSKIYHVTQMEEIAQYIVILAVVVSSTLGASAKNLGNCLQFITSLLYSVSKQFVLD